MRDFLKFAFAVRTIVLEFDLEEELPSDIATRKN
jgi:hypothetical protein